MSVNGDHRIVWSRHEAGRLEFEASALCVSQAPSRVPGRRLQLQLVHQPQLAKPIRALRQQSNYSSMSFPLGLRKTLAGMVAQRQRRGGKRAHATIARTPIDFRLSAIDAAYVAGSETCGPPVAARQTWCRKYCGDLPVASDTRSNRKLGRRAPTCRSHSTSLVTSHGQRWHARAHQAVREAPRRRPRHP